jgi:hypothetical protein
MKIINENNINESNINKNDINENDKYHKNDHFDIDECFYDHSKKIIRYISENEDSVNFCCTTVISVIMLTTFGFIF